MRTNFSGLIIALCIAVFLSGCGYYFPHVYDGPTKSIYLPNWKNRTSELEVDAKLYREITRWFQKSNAVSTTKNKDQADLILAGEIVAIDLPSISWGGDSRTTEVKLSLIVRYVLQDLKSGEILWEVPREMWTQEFSTIVTTATINENEKEALEIIIDDLSEKIYLKTLSKLRRMHLETLEE